eukprot:15185365-Alexandrium_andersonii.AAC.1
MSIQAVASRGPGLSSSLRQNQCNSRGGPEAVALNDRWPCAVTGERGCGANRCVARVVVVVACGSGRWVSVTAHCRRAGVVGR